jgi:hypothetical protein
MPTEASGNFLQFREAEDLACLDSLGVDYNTMEFEEDI